MAQDRVGNEVKVGDLVMVKLNTDHLVARVSKISEPRIQVIRGAFKGGNQEVQPGIMSFAMEYDQLYLPDQRVVDVVKVVDPVPPSSRISEA